MQDSKYSFLFGEPELTTQYGKPGSVLDSIGSTQQETPKESSSSYFSPEAKKSFYQGAQAGGLGSGLLTAGVMSGNPYAAGGGLVLSQIEASQKARQAEEDQRVKQEEEQKKNQMSAINQAINVAKGLGV